MLHVPTPTTAESDAGQLGEATPTYEGIPLSPAVFRKVRAGLHEGDSNQYEVLVSATSVQAQLGLLDLPSAATMFAMAAGVFVDGELMLIEAVAEAEAFGRPYLYRLKLRGPKGQPL